VEEPSDSVEELLTFSLKTEAESYSVILIPVYQTTAVVTFTAIRPVNGGDAHLEQTGFLIRNFTVKFFFDRGF